MLKSIFGKNVFLSGSITNDPDHKSKFADWAGFAKAAGAKQIYNPAELPEGWDYGLYMEICHAFIRHSGLVIQIPGWQKSAGARAEAAYCKSIGKLLVDLDSEKFQELLKHPSLVPATGHGFVTLDRPPIHPLNGGPEDFHCAMTVTEIGHNKDGAEIVTVSVSQRFWRGSRAGRKTFYTEGSHTYSQKLLMQQWKAWALICLESGKKFFDLNNTNQNENE